MSRDVSRGIPFIGIKMMRAADVEERPTIGEAYVKDNLFLFFCDKFLFVPSSSRDELL